MTKPELAAPVLIDDSDIQPNVYGAIAMIEMALDQTDICRPLETDKWSERCHRANTALESALEKLNKVAETF